VSHRLADVVEVSRSIVVQVQLRVVVRVRFVGDAEILSHRRELGRSTHAHFVPGELELPRHQNDRQQVTARSITCEEYSPHRSLDFLRMFSGRSFEARPGGAHRDWQLDWTSGATGQCQIQARAPLSRKYPSSGRPPMPSPEGP
jgi:hypothetical protein